MLKNFKNSNIFLHYILTIFLFISTIFLLSFIMFYKIDEVKIVNFNWIISSYKGEQYKDLPYKVLFNKGKNIKIKNILPYIEEDENLFLYASDQGVKIYIDNNLIFDNNYDSKQFPIIHKIGWIEINLSPEFSNKNIEIELSYDFSDHSGHIFPVYIAKPHNFVKFIAYKYGFNLVFIILCIHISIISIFAYLGISKNIKDINYIIYTFLSIIFASIWAICDNKFIQFLLPFSGLIYNLSFLTSLLFLLPAFNYTAKINNITKFEKYFLSFFFIGDLLYISLKLILELFKIIPFTDHRIYAYTFYLFNCFYLFWLSVKYTIIKNKNINYTIFIIPILVISCFINWSVYMLYENFYNGQFISFGIYIILSIILYQNILKINQKIKLAQELQQYKDIVQKDMMTNTYNKSTFLNDITSFIPKKTSSVIIIKINNIGTINDNHSNLKGDDAILTCVNIIKNNFKEYNIYRTSGNEFTILVDNLEESNITKLIYKTNSDIFFKNDSLEYNLSISTEYEMYNFTSDLDLKDTYIRTKKQLYKKQS